MMSCSWKGLGTFGGAIFDVDQITIDTKDGHFKKKSPFLCRCFFSKNRGILTPKMDGGK